MTRRDARELIVDAAVARLHAHGLTVALDGISLEEAIADAGVPRATAYRRWPNRTEFRKEVLLRTARAARLVPESQQDLSQIRTLLEERHHGEANHDLAARHSTVVEALRIATSADYRRLGASREWRDYLALRVTCNGIADDDLRKSLNAELQVTEQQFVLVRATIYAQVAELFGYRLIQPLVDQGGFSLIAEVTGALMTGLVLNAPDGESHTFTTRAFGSAIEAEWTTASYALTSVLLNNLEYDPDGTWDLEGALERLDAMGDS